MLQRRSVRRRRLLRQFRAHQILSEIDLVGSAAAGAFAGFRCGEPARHGPVLRDDRQSVRVAGFLQPGDRVDILLSRKPAQSVAVVDVVLQNIKLLGVDQTVDDKGGAAKPAVARSVTLEVDTDQAQRLVVAQSVGSLTLVLRPIGDAQLERTHPVTATDLLQEGRARSDAAPGSRATVGVIRNLARQDYSVPTSGSN